MRTLCDVVAFIFICGVSGLIGSQDNPTKDELLATVRHIEKLAKDQQTELDAAHADEQSLQVNLKSALDELSKTQSTLVTVQGEINKLAQHDANETTAKKHILHKYHILKGIACAIAAAVAVFAVMHLTSFIPIFLAPYKIYLYVGAGVGAAGLVAVFL